MFKNTTKEEKFKKIKHIAFIMDGNGRWAKNKLMPRSYGHHEGVKRIKDIVLLCLEYNIEVMSLFCFSTENWKRDKEEVDYLFSLFNDFFEKEVDNLNKKGCKIHVMGDISVLPEITKIYIKHAIELTKDNDKIILNICLNYGGKDEIVTACKRIAFEAQTNLIKIQDINEKYFESKMMCNGLPPIDVMVRTSGEQRLSNFMLWELAYSELIFVKDYWPDFKKKQFISVLREYTLRDRRFGGIVNGNK